MVMARKRHEESMEGAYGNHGGADETVVGVGGTVRRQMRRAENMRLCRSRVRER